MQKIMFNDRYVLTDAVIEGRKTVTRRIIYGIDFPVNMVMGRVLPDKEGKIYAVANGENIIVKLRYKVGEVVAVAQSYNEATREFPHLATTLVGHDHFRLGAGMHQQNVRPSRFDAPPNPHHQNPLRALAGYFGCGVHERGGARGVCEEWKADVLLFRH